MPVNPINRADFPALDRQLYGKPMVYLDNVATSQTPRQVVEAITAGYYGPKANVHRGVHTLSQEATALQEEARRRVMLWLNARSTAEIIFTRGTTEAINLVASSLGQSFGSGDEVLLTIMEHHANIVPWQLMARRTGATIKFAPILPDGSLDIEAFEAMLTPRTRLAAFCHVSNVLGTVNPIRQMCRLCRQKGVHTLVDGAQAVAHGVPDVQDIGCDFYAFSFHKMYGPTGIGVLYGREKLLEEMPPYQGGGEMIAHVTTAGTTFAELPFKFEAGTPDFVGIGAIPAVLDYISPVGMSRIASHCDQLLRLCTRRMLNEVPDIRIYGTSPIKAPIISFLMGHAHHYDIGFLLDKQAIEARTGHHCAQPLMHALGIDGTVRIGFAMYNGEEEVDRLIAALRRIAPMLD